MAGTVNCYKTITPYRPAIDLSGNTTQAVVPTPTVPCPMVNVDPYDLKGLGGHKDTYSATTKKITRRVRKWVFTGEESDWTYSATEHGFCFNLPESERAAGQTPVMCSHFTNTYNYPAEDLHVRGSESPRGNALTFVYQDMHGDMSCSVWKAWLRTLVEEGTPLTIYYVALSPVEEDAPYLEVKSYKAAMSYHPTTDLTGSTTQAGTPTPTNPISVVNTAPYDLRGIGPGTDTYSVTTKKITRNTKKLVLTGDEPGASTWIRVDNGTFHYQESLHRSVVRTNCYCTHFGYHDVEWSSDLDNLKFFSKQDLIVFRYDGINTLDEWKDWVRAQYAAGTPLTVYYPCENYSYEETALSIPVVSYKRSTLSGDIVRPITSDDLFVGTFIVNN